jgi:hypothetical protein
MMVNLIYFYDIISTMNRITVDKRWIVSPDSKYKDEKLKPFFTVASVTISDLASHQMIISRRLLDITSDRFNRLVSRGCPFELLTLLINSMMKIGANITKDYFGKFSVFVNTFNHMTRHIDEAIQKMIDRSFFTDLSLDDARKIVSELKLEEFIYCFEGHESGVCLVVLGPNVRAQNEYEQPWHLFQQEVLKFNASRTIFMTPEQEERLVTCNEDFRKFVEFTSAFNKTTRRVVLSNADDPTIQIIRQRLLVDELEKKYSDAKKELEEMERFEEIRALQKRMFGEI